MKPDIAFIEAVARVWRVMQNFDTDDFDGIEVCDHPVDGVKWNPYNRVTQCHRCGQTIDVTPMVEPPGENQGDGEFQRSTNESLQN